MRAQVRNTKISELQVREDLDFLEREWVIGRLVSKAGVQEALCRPDNPHKFIVEHDADVLDAGDLVEVLHMCGLQANVTPAPFLEQPRPSREPARSGSRTCKGSAKR
jgi:hypothetical protein